MDARIISLYNWTEADQAEVYAALQQGQVIAYPTDTIYGLGVDVYHTGAVETLQQMKGRDSQKPVSVLYASTGRMQRDFDHLSNFQMSAVNAFFPGCVTLLLPVKSEEQFPAPFTRNGTVGVRVVDLPVLNMLLSGYPHPISTTSINPGTQKPAASLVEIQDYFPREISVIIDNGFTENTQVSTIIKLLENSWEIIRVGIVPTESVDAILNSLK
ncbi:threonylcarbamoyl-AMP synthase [bacterium]|nr:threonylcarbamoyl-AMP synthase [bacterium]MBU1633826.1 threonylcarbamoyl-AMP synthase [bacterium]MBU1872913.1 threonylcarbamoyl-AMP synthase [bacterium]